MPDLERALMEVPRHMHESVRNYARVGCPVGNFLTALFSAQPFTEIVGAADEHNQRCLVGWARLLYNGLPSNAHGSPEAVQAWIAKGGLEGKPVDA